MPNKRLGWYKVWVGTSRHAKIVGLSDRSFRVWHELLDAASEQKVRGHFDSIEIAARVIHRKVAEVQPLIRAGLVDSADGGVWLHDWNDWQRWRPEDAANGDGFPPDHPPNDTRSTRDRHTNNNGSTTDQHTNANGITHENPSRGAERAKTETEREIETKPPQSPTGEGRQAMPKPKHERVPISEEDIEDLVGKYAERYGTRQAVRDEIESALNHTARYRAISEKLYVNTWLRRELDHRPASLRLVQQSPRRVVDRTGVAN